MIRHFQNEALAGTEETPPSSSERDTSQLLLALILSGLIMTEMTPPPRELGLQLLHNFDLLPSFPLRPRSTNPPPNPVAPSGAVCERLLSQPSFECVQPLKQREMAILVQCPSTHVAYMRCKA